LKNILFIILLFSFYDSYSQWYRTFNCPPENEDGVNSVVCDKAGNIFVSGYCWTGVDQELNYLLIKYNPSGDTLWTRNYNGPIMGQDLIVASVTDNQNNIIVTGRSENTTGYDIFTMKYNSSGMLVWGQRYNGYSNGYDEPFCISADDSLNIYVTGRSVSPGNFSSIVTIKYNSSGTQQWARRFNGDSISMNKPSVIYVNKTSGNIFITGYITTLSNGRDIITLKYDRFDALQWSRRFNGNFNLNDEGRSIGIDAGENVYVSGIITLDSLNTDFVTIKYSSSGNFVRAIYYSGASLRVDSPVSMSVDSIGNCYVTGYSLLNTGGVVNEFVTIKYDSAGTQKWLSRYSPAGNNIPVSIFINSLSEVIICGKSRLATSSYDDFIAVKYNSQTGTQTGYYRFHFPGTKDNELKTASIDFQNSVILSGNIITDTSVVIGTVKVMNSSIGVNNVSIVLPSSFKLFQNYPNPFNSKTKVRFDVSDHPPYPPSKGEEIVSLKVYDILGKEVQTLVNEQLSPSMYEVTFDGLGLASGIYFYQLRSGEFFETRRLVLLK
jgi:hypothetical protein